MNRYVTELILLAKAEKPDFLRIGPVDLDRAHRRHAGSRGGAFAPDRTWQVDDVRTPSSRPTPSGSPGLAEPGEQRRPAHRSRGPRRPRQRRRGRARPGSGCATTGPGSRWTSRSTSSSGSARRRHPDPRRRGDRAGPGDRQRHRTGARWPGPDRQPARAGCPLHPHRSGPPRRDPSRPRGLTRPDREAPGGDLVTRILIAEDEQRITSFLERGSARQRLHHPAVRDRSRRALPWRATTTSTC